MSPKKLFLTILFALNFFALLTFTILFFYAHSVRSVNESSQINNMQKELKNLQSEWQEWKKFPLEMRAFLKKSMVKDIELPRLRSDIVNIFLQIGLPPPELNFSRNSYFEEIKKSETEIKFTASYQQLKKLLYELRRSPWMIFPLEIELRRQEVAIDARIKLAIFYTV